MLIWKLYDFPFGPLNSRFSVFVPFFSQNCSKFHAGEVLSALRSKGKNKLFDEKGVFGRVCRHDFPKGFHNIKHGERYGVCKYIYLMLCSILYVLSVRELHDTAIIMNLSSWQLAHLYTQYRCILWFFALLASLLYNFVINLNFIL